MDKIFLYLFLDVVFLVPITFQQACPPLPIERGCIHEKQNNVGHCVSKVFCVEYIDKDWSDNTFDNHNSNCMNLFVRSLGYYFGETIYALKNFQDDLIFRDNFARRIVTTLDLSCGEYSDTPKLASSDEGESVLKTLNLSRNALVEAKLFNPYDLKQLINIDLSHNTISNIIVDHNEHVYVRLENINLSHNYLVTVQDSLFEAFSELKHLDLSYNFIDYIGVETFEGLKNLIYLNLNHNRLTNVDNALFRFTKLIELHLSENKIQMIKHTDYDKLSNLIIIDFSYNDIIQIDENSFKNAHLIQTLNLQDNLLENLKKEMFSNMNLLKNIDLSTNHLKSLPKNLFKDKNIEKFSITGNQIEGSLTKGIFEGLNLVTELDLSKQQLTSVEDYAFFGLERLTILLLNDNNLRILSTKSFSMLRSLEILDLSNNQLFNIEFEKDDLVSLRSLQLQKNLLLQVKSDFFTGLNNLQFLDLTFNNISLLGTNSFHTLKDLISFQIANNPISGALEENTFDGLNSLPILDISGTLLTTIKNSSFNGMNQLTKLNASRCNISDLQYNLFLHTGIIETLDLSFNQLSTFEINTTELINLEQILLNNNLFTKISSSFLSGLPRLTYIIISHNQIFTIDDKGFEDQTDLRYLDLSYNPNLSFDIKELAKAQNLISVFLSGIYTNVTFASTKAISLSRLEISYCNIFNLSSIGLQNLKYLKYLILGNNKLQKIEAVDLKGLPKLGELDLSFNKISFIQSGAFKENKLLRFLNISHNILTAVNYGIFTGLIYLETVDISYNDISDLKSERFYEVQSLTTLIADHNKITNLKSDDFSGTNLKKLSIGDNPIPCHVLVNLEKSDLSFDITAIILTDISDDEHFLGVTCNKDKSFLLNKPSNNNLNNEILLSDIKHILLNMSSNTNKGTDGSFVTIEKNNAIYLTNMLDKIDKMSSDLNSTLVQGNLLNSNNSILLENMSRKTTTLLEKIAKILATPKRSDPVSIPVSPKNNFTAENLIPYINKIKQDLEDAMAVERQNLYDEMDKKISDKLSAAKSPTVPPIKAAKPSHEAYSNNKNGDSNSMIFIEVSVGLMLFFMVGFILYNFYNSGMFIPNRRSTSTRHLPDAMDNSTL